MNPYPNTLSDRTDEIERPLLGKWKRLIAQPSAEDVKVVGVLLFLTVAAVRYL